MGQAAQVHNDQDLRYAAGTTSGSVLGMCIDMHPASRDQGEYGGRGDRWSDLARVSDEPDAIWRLDDMHIRTLTLTLASTPQ